MILKPDIVRVYELQGGTSPVNADVAGWQQVKCAWHEDTKPSARLDAATGNFQCFVCDLGGDAFSVLYKVHGWAFPDVRRYLRANQISGDAATQSGKQERYQSPWG